MFQFFIEMYREQQSQTIKIMKRIFIIAAALFMTASVWAQSPEKMSYQAVVRDAGNALVTSQAVGMQLSILQGSISGTPVYVETQTPSTNTNGLVSLEIGSGTVVSGTFNTIDWSNGPYYIKTETDPTGGTTYTITGTSQLMSVPYALHANTADSIVGGVSITAADTTNWNNQTYIYAKSSQTTYTAAGNVTNWTTVETSSDITNDGTTFTLPTGIYLITVMLDGNVFANSDNLVSWRLADGTNTSYPNILGLEARPLTSPTHNLGGNIITGMLNVTGASADVRMNAIQALGTAASLQVEMSISIIKM